MNDNEKHQREMNIAAHLTWSATFLASAYSADNQDNLLSAAFSYYYSTFHAGFALINIDHTFNMAHMERIHHNKIESYLEDKLPEEMSIKAKNLRVTRELLSYLGIGDPAAKLQLVRGHGIRTNLGTKNIRELVDIAKNDATSVFNHIFIKIENFCKSNRWQPLGMGRDYFLEEYLGEDLLLNVIPREGNGRSILIELSNILKNIPIE